MLNFVLFFLTKPMVMLNKLQNSIKMPEIMFECPWSIIIIQRIHAFCPKNSGRSIYRFTMTSAIVNNMFANLENIIKHVTPIIFNGEYYLFVLPVRAVGIVFFDTYFICFLCIQIINYVLLQLHHIKKLIFKMLQP